MKPEKKRSKGYFGIGVGSSSCITRAWGTTALLHEPNTGRKRPISRQLSGNLVIGTSLAGEGG